MADALVQSARPEGSSPPYNMTRTSRDKLSPILMVNAIFRSCKLLLSAVFSVYVMQTAGAVSRCVIWGARETDQGNAGTDSVPMGRSELLLYYDHHRQNHKDCGRGAAGRGRGQGERVYATYTTAPQNTIPVVWIYFITLPLGEYTRVGG